MIKVRLETDRGLVHEALMPEFNPPPEVVIWGIRVFKLKDCLDYPAKLTYTEVFAYVLV